MRNKLNQGIQLIPLTLTQSTSLVRIGCFGPLALYHFSLKRVAENILVGYQDWFDAILNLFPHIELLVFSKTIAFMVDSTTSCGGIFYQAYLLLWLTFPFKYEYWCVWILVFFWLAAQSHQYLYHYMKNHVAIVWTNIYWSKSSDKLINNIIFIIFWKNMCVVSIRKEIIPNILFWYKWQLFVILNVPRNVDFDDTWEVLLFIP